MLEFPDTLTMLQRSVSDLRATVDWVRLACYMLVVWNVTLTAQIAWLRLRPRKGGA